MNPHVNNDYDHELSKSLTKVTTEMNTQDPIPSGHQTVLRAEEIHTQVSLVTLHEEH